jgi:hypothetical protein
MNEILSGLEDYCVIYIDDIVVFSDSWQKHLIHVREVLTRLARARLTVKLIKCYFGENKVDFVGHTVGNGLMTPREAKVTDLLKMPHPSTKAQLHSFVGLAKLFFPVYSKILLFN